MKIIRQIGSLAFVLGLFVSVFVGISWHVVMVEGPAVPWWLKTAIFCFLGGILVVLVTVAVEQRKKPVSAKEEGQPEFDDDILLLNSLDVSGRTIGEIVGLVQGHTVFAIWLGKDLSALVRLVLGGELTEYTEMMGRARSVATNRMIAQAAEVKADAVINIRYMTTSVVASAAELFAYGTAVKLSQ